LKAVAQKLVTVKFQREYGLGATSDEKKGPFPNHDENRKQR
jgi:hypothetical protein